MALFTVRQTRPRAAVKSKDRHTFMYLYILGVALLLVISVSLLQFGLTRPPKDFHVHPDPRHARKGVSEDLRGGLHHHRQRPGENPSRRRRPPVMKVEKKKTGAAEEETTTQEGRDIVDDGESSRMYQGQQLDDMDQFYREQAKVENLDRANKRHTFGDDLLAKFVEDRQFGEKSDDPVKKGSVRAAIEQEMAKRRTGRDNSLRRSLGETGMAPPREFLDDGKRKSSLHTDEEPNVKGEEDAGDDVQTAVKDVVVHSSHVEEENSEPALEINNLIALTTTSTALVEDHLESVDDVVQTDKQVIKEEDEDEKRLVAEKNLKELEVEKVEEQGELKEGRGKNAKDEKEEGEGDEDHDNMIQWGFYPTLSSTLKFSKFLSSFFKQEKCTLRIFMAWTTAPWAYTPRHQRAIESILHFHPEACIVVFTETVDFKFFDSWVKEGYKIAVARPNLEELLGKTPAIDFAYVWYEWRSMNLFYIHYTELLRIAALHKYGGVWLDMDMILARPLPKLHNVLGSTVAEDGEWVLNGAFMSFDRSSSFLKACIEEFVATYDERLLGWNGADLLNRVASNATRKGGKVWLEHSEHLQVLEPIAFFPLSRHNIIKYFSAPKRVHERVKQKKMLSAILGESHGTHLWNSVTGRLVPEVGSVVEQLLNHFCMRCTDIL